MAWRCLSLVGCIWLVSVTLAMAETRPNILLCISDDQSWIHTGAMGDLVVKTPAFDRVAREGILFTHAFCDAPSCAPSRSAILTGQPIWRLEEAGNLHSRMPEKFDTYVRLLEQVGYTTGSQDKAWAPGQFKTENGWIHNSRSKLNPAGSQYDSFQQFLDQKPEAKPFCFWLGSDDPHRPYELNSGAQSGMNHDLVDVPAHLPNDIVVRNDILDYYWEIQRFDQRVAEALASLERIGELDNTLVVVTSDHGMPFPRSKASLYDYGTRVPLAIRWPGGVESSGRANNDLISLSDLAATFVEVAGLEIPESMTARSLVGVLSNQAAPQRDAVYVAMERHDGCRPGGAGYPCRAIRTHDFLYIRNYAPDRWPAGDPDPAHCARAIPFGEVDSSPTKSFIMDRANEPHIQSLHQLAFGMRPDDELYEVKSDVSQLINIASVPDYFGVKQDLSARLEKYTRESGDPRALGLDAPWDHYPYYGVRINRDWSVNKVP